MVQTRVKRYICPRCGIIRDKSAIKTHISKHKLCEPLLSDANLSNPGIVERVMKGVIYDIQKREVIEDFGKLGVSSKVDEDPKDKKKTIQVSDDDVLKKKFTILGQNHYMLYDKDDQYTVDSRRWYMIVDRSGSPRVVDGKGRGFHSYLIKSNKGTVVDHINGNTLDNTRKNLREITQQQNVFNRKPQYNKYGYPGISFDSRWKASIVVDSITYSESFDTRVEAITWRYNKQIEHRGEYNYETRSLDEILKDIEHGIPGNKKEEYIPGCVYFKMPITTSDFEATLEKNGKEHVVYYGRDNHGLSRFKNSKKYQLALLGKSKWEWEEIPK